MINFKKVKSVVLSGMMAVASVAGSFTVAAPSLNAAAASGSDDYAKLLQYSLYLYDANMCGDEVEQKSGMTWRSNCHTTDEVKGGFHDAGDHAMFGLPQGYTASSLGWGYYEYKDVYNATGQAEHFKVISDHFNDFFKASTKLSGDTVTNFLYQKGDGDEDHGYWGPPEKQGGSRKMFWTSAGASDIAADYAASLALSYLNFGDEEDLKYAKALYKFSTQYNQVATDGPNTFYKSSGCQDEQANAAGWLYIATGDEKYKNDCASKQTEYLGWVDGWDNRGLGAACVYALITNNWNKVNSYIGGLANGSNYLFMDKWGSARLNTTMQFCALVASKHSSADFTGWAKGQMDYITGNNPTGTNFVVGFSGNSAKNPHHRAASGYNSYQEFDGSAHPMSISPNGHSLIGALVGGPTDAGGTYSDDMNDYVCNEVACDYNAGFVSACAGLYEVYKTGKTVSSIEGVDKIYNGSVDTPNPPVTTPPTTTPSPTPSSKGSYTVDFDQEVDYPNIPEDERMLGFKWNDFNINYGETIKEVQVNISANGNIGKWEGAFGSSTKSAPDYWTQTDNMSETFSGNKGTITWKLDDATAKIINTTGDLKFGVWWVDCQKFNIDSITVITDAYSGTTPTPVQTTAPQPIKPTVTTTTKANTPSPSGNGEYENKVNQSVDYNKLPENDKMIGWEWADFGIGANETIKKVEINISANGNIGKWQGAFGSSTKVAPDYWTQTDEMEQTFSGNKGTITWNIDSATAKIIQTQYGGELKFGIWWIDCKQFTIDSIKVYTDGSSTVTPTNPPTTKPPVTNPPATNPPIGNVSLYGDANCDGKVSIADSTAILQHLGNQDKYGLSSQGLANADVCNNGDGVKSSDALAIQMVDASILKASDLPVKDLPN